MMIEEKKRNICRRVRSAVTKGSWAKGQSKYTHNEAWVTYFEIYWKIDVTHNFI